MCHPVVILVSPHCQHCVALLSPRCHHCVALLCHPLVTIVSPLRHPVATLSSPLLSPCCHPCCHPAVSPLSPGWSKAEIRDYEKTMQEKTNLKVNINAEEESPLASGDVTTATSVTSADATTTAAVTVGDATTTAAVTGGDATTTAAVTGGDASSDATTTSTVTSDNAKLTSQLDDGLVIADSWAVRLTMYHDSWTPALQAYLYIIFNTVMYSGIRSAVFAASSILCFFFYVATFDEITFPLCTSFSFGNVPLVVALAQSHVL